MVLNNRKAQVSLNPTSVADVVGVIGRDAPRMVVVQDQARAVAHLPNGRITTGTSCTGRLRRRTTIQVMMRRQRKDKADEKILLHAPESKRSKNLVTRATYTTGCSIPFCEACSIPCSNSPTKQASSVLGIAWVERMRLGDEFRKRR